MTTDPMAAAAAREHFERVVADAHSALVGDEVLLTTFTGEDSDFVRFNGESVRQAGSVVDRGITLDLIDGARHTVGTLTLTGDGSTDTVLVADCLRDLRDQRRFVPEDPYLLYATEPATTERDSGSRVPDGAEAVDRVLDAAKGNDLVGIYAAGDTYCGFASSTGVRHWHRSATFNLDWCFYLQADKAAKNLYAGQAWDDDAFDAKVAWSRQQLDALRRKPIDLEPGRYRTYFAPTALQELVEILSWGGFGLKAHRTKTTPFLRMVTEGATFHPSVRISEDLGGGTAPRFQSQGFVSPDEVVLIDGGAYVGHLISPRSAQEFGEATNGAESFEAPRALSIAGGDLPRDAVLEELDTGLYVGNLWYLNYSDRASCRTTGMTRFATFWVDDGEIAAPVNVLRYDDTAYRMLGDELVAFDDTVETILDPSTYGGRSTASSRLPGALVSEVIYTL